MPKFIDQIIIGIATFILSVFLPKHFITLIREIIKFIVISIFKYWYFTSLVVGTMLLYNYKTDCRHLDQFNSITFILTTTFVVLVIVPTISLLFIIYKKNPPFNIAFYGCFSVKENEYLTVDIDSESLNEKMEKNIEKVSSTFYSFKNNFVTTSIINLPKFVPILLGSKGLNKFIKSRVVSKKHMASIHFIRDINKQNLSVVINYDNEMFIHSTPMHDLEKLVENLSIDSNIHNSKLVDFNIKIYMMFFGQSIIDFLVDLKKLSEVNYILNDVEKILVEIQNNLQDLPEKHKNSLDILLNFWNGHVERYRGIIFIEQKQYIPAIRHIIKSIKLNPYYPYTDYDTLKKDYTKKYAINLTPKMNEVMEEIKESELDVSADDQNFVEKNEQVRDNLLEQVDFLYATFNYDLLREIIKLDQSEKTRKILIDEFEQLDKKNPFILLSISEVIKYVEKGSEKFNEIYVERFDETITLLREILKLDDEFPLINTKLGSMITMKGWHFNNSELIEQGMEEWVKGNHYMSQLGFFTEPNR